jgi:hypothetical protein
MSIIDLHLSPDASVGGGIKKNLDQDVENKSRFFVIFSMEKEKKDMTILRIILDEALISSP